MAFMEDEMARLFNLLDREITTYRLMGDELKKESECLREGAIDALLSVVKEIGRHTETLRQLQRAVEASIESVLPAQKSPIVEKSLSCLIDHVPSVHRRQIKSYQLTIGHLQGWIKQMNEKNKAFIREHLNFFATLTSSLVHPNTETVFYPKTRRPSREMIPAYAFNREV